MTAKWIQAIKLPDDGYTLLDSDGRMFAASLYSGPDSWVLVDMNMPPPPPSEAKRETLTEWPKVAPEGRWRWVYSIHPAKNIGRFFGDGVPLWRFDPPGEGQSADFFGPGDWRDDPVGKDYTADDFGYDERFEPVEDDDEK